MCIELYINKVLVFSQCEQSKFDSNFSNISNNTQVYIPNHTRLNSTIVNLTNFTALLSVENNYTYRNQSLGYKNLTNHTQEIYLNNSQLLNGTYNASMQVVNMTPPYTVYMPNITSVSNITVNQSHPMNVQEAERAYETIAEVLLKIVLPLVFLGIIWICIACKRKKTKVQCVKMIENPYFGADVETPNKHKDPGANIEHKDPGSESKQNQASNTEPRL